MPDNLDAWALDDQAHQQGAHCTVRPGTTIADCTCNITNGVPYCWMPLTYLVKNNGNQGHRWYMLVYDKKTNQLIGGGKTNYVAYLDNPSKVPRWGYDTGHDGTWVVQNCGERKEYHEEADLYSPGSWVETGQIIYAEASGCPTPTPTPTPVLSCTDLTVTPAPTKGQKIVLTCTGTSVPDPINHFEFRVSVNGGTPNSLPNASAVKVDNTYKGEIEYTIPDYGCYKIECRACTSNDSSKCTEWGKAQ